MNSAWIGALGVLAGVLVGAIAEAIRGSAAFRREKAWTLYEERRSKLEQVYEALEQVAEVYSQLYVEAIRAVTRRKPSEPTGEKVPWARLRLLVNLYVPELLPELKAVQEAGRELGGAIGHVTVDAAEEPSSAQYYVDEMHSAQENLDRALNQARNNIIKESTRLAEETVRRTDRKLIRGK